MLRPLFSNFKELLNFYSSNREGEVNKTKAVESVSKKTRREIIINEFINELNKLNDVHDNSSLYHIGGSISGGCIEKLHKKLDSANITYAKGLAYNYILYVDTTMFGSGKCGMLFTPKRFYFSADHGDDVRHYTYEELFGLRFRVEEGNFYIGHCEYQFFASEAMDKLQPVVRLLTQYFTENGDLSIIRFGE